MKLQTQAAQIFLRAAAYIRKYGWQKSGMGIYGQPRCSMGALASANTEPLWDSNLAELMYEVLNDELRGISLTQFNKKSKNGEEVALLFEKTAKNLKGI